jgi:hypothetical protein
VQDLKYFSTVNLGDKIILKNGGMSQTLVGRILYLSSWAWGHVTELGLARLRPPPRPVTW